MDTNDNIIKKLEYIGLDLENIPDSIKHFEPLEYRPSKFIDEHKYRVYKYINACDIEILLTKANRLTSISEKYKNSVPLYSYLNPNEEENIERHTKFLSMVSNMDIEQIEELEEEQKILKTKIPFKIKYKKDYLWQIYYSELTNKYFMLVPTEDLEYSAFFYVLKKQLENNNEKIFVPISYMDYTREYLTKSQISDLENYLWLFTKEWPLIYEVHDINENISLYIVGKAFVFDDIQSYYKIELKNNEDALKLYKLLKALFIMQTEIPHHLNFKASIDKNGSLEFNINSKKVIYEILPSLIKEEYLKAEENKINITDRKLELEKELDNLQKKSSKLEKEYLDREKQIAIFLECRKTFFGRVKYFIKFKKVKLTKQVQTEESKQEIKLIRLNKYGEVKSNYTIEELIETCKQIDKEENKEKNLQLDIKAIKQRIENLESKVKNANIYIEEIDKHKKSIFDFWKFTNKDKQAELPAGEEKTEDRKKLKKTFEYSLDFEDFSKGIDKKQREALTKQEFDSAFLTTTDILKDINNIEGITEERFIKLKERAIQEKNILDKETFDIFGGMSYDNKLNTLANQKHRESKKDLFNILPITKYTTLEEYKQMIKENTQTIKDALDKIEVGIPMPIYKCVKEDEFQRGFNLFSIRASDVIKPCNNDEIEETLFKINLNENTKIIACTNSVYYENTNKTLPLGMNVEEKVILDTNKVELELKEQKEINIVFQEEPQNEFSSIRIKQIKIKEYNIIE